MEQFSYVVFLSELSRKEEHYTAPPTLSKLEKEMLV